MAGYGKVELQAQDNQINLDAKQDIQITSHDGKLTLYSPKEINLVCGKNSFIHMNPDQVIINAPDHIIERTAVVMKQNVGSMPLTIPPLPIPIGDFDEQFILTTDDGDILSNTLYTIKLEDDTLMQGISDEFGKTDRVKTNQPQKLEVYLGHIG